MRETGVLVCGMLAAAAGVVGIVWLGMSGLAWDEGQLKPTTSYDESEVGLGIGVMAFFWTVGSGLLLAAVISALRRAHVEPDRKAYFVRLAWLVPLVVVVLVVLLWPVLLGTGGENFAP